ncbi:MAG: hypothetical protein U1D97_11615, partial [Desulfuromonadales bacterium]|nr:hypothetical protein [Desulfuromonadales bacterium]
VAETLTWRERSPKSVTQGVQLNERFIWLHQETKTRIFPVGLTVEKVIDLRTNEPVVKRISVWAGYSGDKELYRFWVKQKPYIPNKQEFEHYWLAYKQLGREVK